MSKIDLILDKIADEIVWERAYYLGIREPNYAIPAVITKVAVVPSDVDSPYSASITVWQLADICPCCGNPFTELVAIWDFDFDRAADFFLPLGVYCNGREMEHGMDAYRLLLEKDTSIQ